LEVGACSWTSSTRAASSRCFTPRTPLFACRCHLPRRQPAARVLPPCDKDQKLRSTPAQFPNYRTTPYTYTLRAVEQRMHGL
jgi:hypothetical protein